MSNEGQSSNDAPVQLATEIAEVVNDLVKAGVAFSNQTSMGDLLDALGDAGLSNVDEAFDQWMFSGGLQTTNGQPAVQGFVAKAESNVIMSDELAKALADAGMFEAVPAARVQIDAGSNELLKTPFKLLAEYGVAKVTTTQDKLYIELGDVADLNEMASMLETLVSGDGGQFGLFHHEGGTAQDGTEVQAALVVDESTKSTMANSLLSSDALAVLQDLEKLGVQEIQFKSTVVPQDIPDFAVSVQILGGDYNTVDLQKLIEKYHG